MRVVTRAGWGAKDWRPKREMYRESMPNRTEVLAHYHGGPPRYSRGVQVPRDVEAIHLGNGWAGVGYNWLVDLDGVAYEGRGWDLVGAHCPGHNRTGIGIYVAVGGTQQPTPAALATFRGLYDEACRRSGKTLRKTWHGANWPTACPGPNLIAWVRAGMPRPNIEDQEDDMALTEEDAKRLAAAVWAAGFGGRVDDDPRESAGDRLGQLDSAWPQFATKADVAALRSDLEEWARRIEAAVAGGAADGAAGAP